MISTVAANDNLMFNGIPCLPLAGSDAQGDHGE